MLYVVLIFSGQQARADIIGAHSLQGDCVVRGAEKRRWNGAAGYTTTAALTPGKQCRLASNLYAPRSEMYQVETSLFRKQDGSRTADAVSGEFNLDATKTISQQSVNAPANEVDFRVYENEDYIVCQYILDKDGIKYMFDEQQNNYPECTAGTQPLPPTPGIPDTSCIINSGNALNVNLSTVDRAQLPTVPGSGSMRHIQVPVDCTGGSVTVNMQLNYTPIIFTAGQVIKSSSNGLGVSVVYDSKLLSSTDITPVNFLAGANTLDLAFQAVRDPNVEIKDVPTGAFTASAVLVMTQQ